MKNNWIRIIAVLAIVAANIGLDQWTKAWAKKELQYQMSQSFWDNFFRLTYVENEGAFLSLGSDLSHNWRTTLLHWFPAVVLVIMFFYTLFSRELNKWQTIGMSFILGGGISNIYDRIAFGKVTDFMNMGIGDLRTGVFNFADVSIMLGLAIMLPYAFSKDKKEDAPATPTTPEEADTRKHEGEA
ncbi:MAG: signal peptidase II [Saprospiraceae bacterium]